MRKVAREYEATGDFTNAIETIKRASILGSAPADIGEQLARLRVAEGRLHAKSKEYQAAIASYAQALRMSLAIAEPSTAGAGRI